MTRALLAIVASLALLGDGPSLAGSVYRNTGGPNATAVGGALVYVHSAADTSGGWAGPALTDAYGRFSFPVLWPGQYLLRVFVQGRTSWQQVVTVPAVLKPIVIDASRS